MMFGDLNDPESEIAKAVKAKRERGRSAPTSGSTPASATRTSEVETATWRRLQFRTLTDHSASFWGHDRRSTSRCSRAGSAAALYMEEHGHIVTGMSNQIVWGLPHVFAVFLIVSASGALNVASISSVFNRLAYKPYARLSGVLAIALLAGGLMVLVLDLGRPERVFVAMTHNNFRSIFAWNIYLYSGFVAIVAAYLFSMMDRRASPLGRRSARRVGVAGLRLAPRADHRHRLDLRLPDRPRGL